MVGMDPTLIPPEGSGGPLCGGPLHMLDELDHVQDQRHGAVAENRGAGQPAHIPEEPAERFDDGLLPADHVVHDQSDALVVGLGHDDLLARGSVPGHLEPVPQPQVRHEFAADFRNPRPSLTAPTDDPAAV